MVLKYEDLVGSTVGQGSLPTGPSLPSATPAAAAAPGAPDAPIGPGMQGPYFQPGEGGSAAAGLSTLESGSPKRPVPTFDQGFFNQMRNTLSGMISGRDVPFTDAIIRGAKGNAWAASHDAAAQGVSQANQDSLRRGVFRSAAGVNDAAAARDRAAQGAVAATANIDTQAAQANYSARAQAIQQGKALLDQLAQRIQSAEALGVDVSRQKAELMLAYDRITSAERMQHNDLNAALERQIVGGQYGS